MIKTLNLRKCVEIGTLAVEFLIGALKASETYRPVFEMIVH